MHAERRRSSVGENANSRSGEFCRIGQKLVRKVYAPLCEIMRGQYVRETRLSGIKNGETSL